MSVSLHFKRFLRGKIVFRNGLNHAMPKDSRYFSFNLVPSRTHFVSGRLAPNFFFLLKSTSSHGSEIFHLGKARNLLSWPRSSSSNHCFSKVGEGGKKSVQKCMQSSKKNACLSQRCSNPTDRLISRMAGVEGTRRGKNQRTD